MIATGWLTSQNLVRGSEIQGVRSGMLVGQMNTAPAGAGNTEPEPDRPFPISAERRASLMVSMPDVSSHIDGRTTPIAGCELMAEPVKIPYRTRTKVSRGVRRRVYVRDDWTCQYCGVRIEPLTPEQASGLNAPVDMSSGSEVWLELDHVVPRSLGGSNSFSNLRAACSPCNRGKSDSTQAADWELRAARAMEILTTHRANRSSVQAAVRALAGVTVHLDYKGRASLS